MLLAYSPQMGYSFATSGMGLHQHPGKMSQQPPRDAAPCQSHPAQRRCGDGTNLSEPDLPQQLFRVSILLHWRGEATPLPSLKTAEYTGFPLPVFRFRLFPLNSPGSPAHGRHVAPNGASGTLSATAWLLTCCYPGKGRVWNCVNTCRAGCHNLGLSQLFQSWSKLFADHY